MKGSLINKGGQKRRTTVADLERALAGLVNLLGGLENDPHQFGIQKDLTWVRHDIRVLSNQVKELESLKVDVMELKKVAHAVGPLWKTQQGQVRPITMLSTDHLQNILGGDFGTLGLRMRIGEEIKRREIDAQWRRKKNRGLVLRLRAAWRAFKNPGEEL